MSFSLECASSVIPIFYRVSFLKPQNRIIEISDFVKGNHNVKEYSLTFIDILPIKNKKIVEFNLKTYEMMTHYCCKKLLMIIMKFLMLLEKCSLQQNACD